MRPRPNTSLAPHSTRRGSPELTRNSILRISDAKTIQLIQEWEKRECLWNTNLPDYPNKEERAKATAAIAKILDLPNFNREHVTMKFKNLRNSFCQELKRMASDDKYKPKVLWFHYMDRFIKPHLQKFNSIDANKATAKDKPTYTIVKAELDSDEEEDNNEDWTVQSISPSEASASTSIRIESTFSEKPPSENGENSNQSQTTKRKLSHDSTPRSETLRRRRSENGEYSDPLLIDSTESQVKTVQKKTPRKEVTIGTQSDRGKRADCYDSFGTYVASLLRTLPHRTALMLQPKIIELITTVGLDELNDNDSES